jgi:hypothetical protein
VDHLKVEKYSHLKVEKLHCPHNVLN